MKSRAGAHGETEIIARCQLCMVQKTPKPSSRLQAWEEDGGVMGLFPALLWGALVQMVWPQQCSLVPNRRAACLGTLDLVCRSAWVGGGE